MKTEADKLRNSIQYGLGVMDSGSGEFKELSNKIDELFELSYLEGQSSPKIKQLEWEALHSNHYVKDTNPIGYRAKIREWHIWSIKYVLSFAHSGEINAKIYDTLEEAKAAAQADFEKRVMECLDLKAQQKQALIDTMRGDEEIGLYDDNPKNHGYER